jgi:hypothetical protein
MTVETEDFDRVAFSSGSPMDMRTEVAILRSDTAIRELCRSVYHADAMLREALAVIEQAPESRVQWLFRLENYPYQDTQ